MQINRRNFIAGTAVAGTVAVAAQGVFGKDAPQPVFGPNSGQALLSRNENPYGPAPSALQAITDTATKGCYYSDKGVAKLRDMIAERHMVAPEQVVIGEGSTEILSAIALAWGAKGTIVCPSLFWDTTVQYGERQGAKAIRVPLAGDMDVDLAGMAAAVDDSVSLVHICNPNNPTAMLIDPAKMRAFAAQVVPKATLLVDEAYNELVDDPAANTLMDLVREGQDVIVCRTFSKIYGMAGMRVGYAITSPENARLIGGYLMSFGGNVSGLAAAIASYNDHGFLEKSKAVIVEGRSMILDAVKQAGLTSLPSQTNFVYVEVSDANAVQKAMAERGISIRGAYGPWKQYSRVSTGKLDDVSRYCAALPEVIGGLA
ncbi:aminotransferase class I/II-fold pyridoxal phosphate-dependent enzyme [Altererythrobacter salegens]|uniref:Aminotransferase class I/II-fold pyridoxal phosphate-dependent enzyme n=1 Tax=Croceibacterium salegens TaxID=1737568 RepID=A0A6I4SY71_9SPHN|nr:histidinol-phosphate transaminase [Croceibacterium salegens]MXO61044.1 aminotransferase class I/II-fold pyridoxal phosphate-dependent enzyme [Croceibacterium salegens]